MSLPAVFFDRDNTLIVGADYLGNPAGVVLMPGAAACVAAVRRLGFAVVVVSNQSGVARGKYTNSDVQAVNGRMDAMLRAEDPNAVVDAHEFCPHHPQAQMPAYRLDCDCRKPKPGLIRRATAALGLDVTRSWLVGDAPRDIEAGATAGCRTILLSVPDIEQSPAALLGETVVPDFRVASLAEAAAVIARQAGRP